MKKCNCCENEIDINNEDVIEYGDFNYCSEFCLIKMFKESEANDNEDPICKQAS